MPETATLRTPPAGAPPRKTFWSQLAQAFAMFRNPKSIAGLIILGVFVLVAILAPWIAPYGPTQKDRTALRQPPSWEHWLGTTHMGEDVLSQIIYGTRGVIVVGFPRPPFIATIIAITIGVIAGYVRGWKSESLSALTNVFLVIPGIPLIIIIASQFENPPLIVIAAVLGLTGWAWGARRAARPDDVAAQPRLRSQAARANGEPLRRIITVEMLPNLMAHIGPRASSARCDRGHPSALTTLAFIGEIPVSNLNWGTILSGRSRTGRSRGPVVVVRARRALHRHHRRRPLPHQLRHRRIRQPRRLRWPESAPGR